MFGSNKTSRIVGIVRPTEEEEDVTRDQEKVRDPDDNKYKKETRKLPAWTALVVLGLLLSVFTVVWLLDSRLPRALTTADIPAQPEAFIEERARNTLRALTSIGARPAGSYENEVLAVELLKRELHSIQQRTSSANKLSIDIQVETGENWPKKTSQIASHDQLSETARKFQPPVPGRSDSQLQERPERGGQAGVRDRSQEFSPRQLSFRLCSSVTR